MSIEVTWEVVSTDDVTGDITVKFTNGTKQNLVNYKWEGDKDEFIKKMNREASVYAHIWMCSPISSGIKTELFNLSGSVSSNDLISLDSTVYSFLKPEII